MYRIKVNHTERDITTRSEFCKWELAVLNQEWSLPFRRGRAEYTETMVARMRKDTKEGRATVLTATRPSEWSQLEVRRRCRGG